MVERSGTVSGKAVVGDPRGASVTLQYIGRAPRSQPRPQPATTERISRRLEAPSGAMTSAPPGRRRTAPHPAGVSKRDGLEVGRVDAKDGEVRVGVGADPRRAIPGAVGELYVDLRSAVDDVVVGASEAATL